MKYLYILLTGIFLLTFGPFNTNFVSLILEWNIITLTVCILIYAILIKFYKQELSCHNSIFIILSLLCAGSIIINAVFHGIALHTLPDIRINIMGDSVFKWEHSNMFLTLFHLFFPVLLLLQLTLQPKIELKVIIRIFSILITISILVLFYQKFIDIRFFNKPFFMYQGRVGGLSHDANAFAMTAFLLIPLMIVGIILEKLRSVKIYYGLLVVALLIGMTYTGNRTAFTGMILMTVIIPAIIAFERRRISKNIRLALLIAPFILVIIVLFGASYVESDVLSHAPSVQRLASTLKELKEGGLRAVFFNAEQRGPNFIVAWEMFKNSPLAGWGPGGFYREAPTFLYKVLGYKMIVDSALNHYLMIGAELGVFVLLINLAIIMLPVVIAIRTIRRTSDSTTRVVLAILLSVNIIFLLLIATAPPTYFPGLVWVWTAQIAYLVIMGENINIKTTVTAKCRRILSVLVVGIIVLVSFGAYQTSFGSKGYIARQQFDWWPYRYEKNCYEAEMWKDNYLQWCKKDASIQFPIERTDSYPTVFRAKLMVNHPDLESKPVMVRYGGKEGLVHTALFNDYGTKEIEIYVTDDYVYDFVDLQNYHQRRFVLSLDVSRTWIPKEWGLSEDRRELGVALIIPKGSEPFEY